jgi:hypothetical protein
MRRQRVIDGESNVSQPVEPIQNFLRAERKDVAGF